MSWLVASLYDLMMQPSERECVGAWRKELLAQLSGEVLEIGAGTGYNVPHYPRDLARLTLAEPDAAMRARLVARSADLERAGRVSVLNASAETLPFPNASLDAVVGTLVLCTIADPGAALAEVRRVLKPRGQYVFLEHGAAAAGSTRLRWQKRLEPLWRLGADGCHLTRRADDILVAAGFVIEHQKRESMRKALPFLRPTIRGIARRSD
jgi:ubiquinone/menaquinone biosynthesis C-methylase UbiE